MPSKVKRRVLVLGGGFGGVLTAKHLRRGAGDDVEVVLINRHNFFVFQPLLAEIAGGGINPSDGVTPLRRFLPGVVVMVAEIRGIDLGAKTASISIGGEGGLTDVPFDQLVIALGQAVDLTRTPGLDGRAFVMKDVVDAYAIRNQVLGSLEDADATTEPTRRQSLLSFVTIGGGFTGVETVGEVQELIRKSLKYYPSIRADEIRTILIQHGPRILPELPEHLGAYAAEQLRRRGVEIRLDTGVTAVTAAGVETGDGPAIDAETIIAAIGNAPSPILGSLPVTMEHGRIVVDRHMRVHGQTDVWAVGDAAHIPLGEAGGDEVAYAPPLAQFAVREAKVLARNILACLDDRPLEPFEYRSLGTMAALGARRGVADIFGVQVRGFAAWVAWRLFYLGLLPGIATRVRVAADWLLDVLVSRSTAEVRSVDRGSREVRFRAGDVAVEPGIDPCGAYIVTAGSFLVGVDGPTAGCPSSTRELAPGGQFGMSLKGDAGATDEWVRAGQDATAYFVAKRELQRLATVTSLLDAEPKSNPAAGNASADGGGAG